MAIVFTDNKYYAEIAAAIRQKNGSSDKYTPAQMAAAILALGKSSRLPEGYTELEFIQSTGEQFINSLFTPNQDTRIVLKYGGCNASEWREVFGAGASVKVPSKNFVCVQHSSNGVMAELGTEYYTAPITTDGAILDLNKNEFYVNGTLVKTFTYAAFTSPYTMRLFDAATDSEDYSRYAGKLYYCQIYDNGTHVRDFVPCKNPDGEIGLYDSIGGKFYGNAGTGAFTGA